MELHVNQYWNTMNDLDTVGKRIRSERTRLGFNVRDFAEKGGIGVGTQSRYENDESPPKSEYLNKISALGAEILWIMSGSEEDDEVRDKRAAPYPPEIRNFLENYQLCPTSVKASLRAIAEEAADKKREQINEWKATGTISARQGGSEGDRDTLRVAITELQAWQVREQRFLPPEKFAEAVFALKELAEDKPEQVKPAVAKVLRLVA